MAAEPHDEFIAADIKAEIQRLKAKQSAVDDEDIRLALQGRIDALETQLKSAAKQEEQPESPELPKATPDQLTKADQLIRQARVEKMRNNSARALALMKEAAEVAPSAPAVLEAYGDDLAERRQFKEAMATYKLALK